MQPASGAPRSWKASIVIFLSQIYVRSGTCLSEIVDYDTERGAGPVYYGHVGGLGAHVTP